MNQRRKDQTDQRSKDVKDQIIMHNKIIKSKIY